MRLVGRGERHVAQAPVDQVLVLEVGAAGPRLCAVGLARVRGDKDDVVERDWGREGAGRVELVLQEEAQLVALGLPGGLEDERYVAGERGRGLVVVDAAVAKDAVGKGRGRLGKVGEVEGILVGVLNGCVLDKDAVGANLF